MELEVLKFLIYVISTLCTVTLAVLTYLIHRMNKKRQDDKDAEEILSKRFVHQDVKLSEAVDNIKDQIKGALDTADDIQKACGEKYKEVDAKLTALHNDTHTHKLQFLTELKELELKLAQETRTRQDTENRIGPLEINMREIRQKIDVVSVDVSRIAGYLSVSEDRRKPTSGFEL